MTDMTTAQLKTRHQVIGLYMDHLYRNYISQVSDTDAVEALLHALSCYQLDIQNRIDGSDGHSVLPILKAGMKSASDLVGAIEGLPRRDEKQPGFIGQAYEVCKAIVSELGLRTTKPFISARLCLATDSPDSLTFRDYPVPPSYSIN